MKNNNCKHCKNYTRYNVTGLVSWCKKGNCYISRPNTYFCYHFELKWFYGLAVWIIKMVSNAVSKIKSVLGKG